MYTQPFSINRGKNSANKKKENDKNKEKGDKCLILIILISV